MSEMVKGEKDINQKKIIGNKQKENNFLVMADERENHFERSRLFVHSFSPTKIDYVSILSKEKNLKKS